MGSTGHKLFSKDIGSVTAYGDAITGGYEGSKETFYSFILNQGGFSLPINPSIKPEECTMYIDDVPKGERENVIIPSYASGKIVYDGQSHTVTFDNVDTDLMNVDGVFTATNAGTYYAEFSLKNTDTHQWEDGGIWKQRFPWTIEKMAGVLTLSDGYVLFDDGVTTKDITFTASNTVTVEVKDSSIATASVNGNTITVTMVDGAVGSTDLIVTCAESENQAGVVKTLVVYANYIPIYGAEWSGGAETTWTRTDEAELFADPIAAIGNGNGSSPFDNIFPWSDIKIVEDEVAGTLVEIPKYYYKWTYNGTAMKLQISPIQFDGSVVSPMHSDRGDGQGERDFAYIGRYPCSSTFKSENVSTLANNLTRAQFRTSIHALGSDIWQNDFATYWTIRNLMLVEFANWNTNSVIGKASSSSSAIGLTDGMKYHTGTSSPTREDATGAVQYRHIEMNGNSEFIDGLYFSGASIYVNKKPSTFADSASGSTMVLSRYVPSSGGYSYAKTMTHPTVRGFEFALYEAASGGSANTYTCARYYSANNSAYIPYRSYENLFSIECCASSSKSTSIYSRLMKLPNVAQG